MHYHECNAKPRQQLVVPISFPELNDCAYTWCRKNRNVRKIFKKSHFEIRHYAMSIRDVREWLATFPFPHSHSRPTNERHLSLNNQTMINVQNTNTELS